MANAFAHFVFWTVFGIIYGIGMAVAVYLLATIMNNTVLFYRRIKNAIAVTKIGELRFHRYCQHMDEIDRYLAEHYPEPEEVLHDGK